MTEQQHPVDPIQLLSHEVLATVHEILKRICHEEVAKFWMTRPESRPAILDHIIHDHMESDDSDPLAHLLKVGGLLAVAVSGDVVMEEQNTQEGDETSEPSDINLEHYDGDLQA